MPERLKSPAKLTFATLPRKKLRVGVLPAVKPAVYAKTITNKMLPEKLTLAESLYKGYKQAVTAPYTASEERPELEELSKYWQDVSFLLAKRKSKEPRSS